MSNNFKFSNSSESKLVTVEPTLQKIVRNALADSAVDFCVNEGVRTFARQQHLLDTGRSHTLKSKHLKHEDGYSHAVDLVPYADDKLQWQDLVLIKMVAQAMFRAAYRFDLHKSIRWGGAWTYRCRPAALITNKIDGVNSWVVEAFYLAREDDSWLDGYHFEMIKGEKKYYEEHEQSVISDGEPAHQDEMKDCYE